jgi:DNA-binding protein H-NS
MTAMATTDKSKKLKTIHITDLEEIPLEELISLRSDMDRLIKKKQREKAKVIKSQMVELAAVAGYDSVEAFLESQSRGRKPRTDKGSSKPPKFQNPTDPSKTWSGQGRAPNWLLDYEKKKGKSRDDLLIKA